MAEGLHFEATTIKPKLLVQWEDPCITNDDYAEDERHARDASETKKIQTAYADEITSSGIIGSTARLIASSIGVGLLLIPAAFQWTGVALGSSFVLFVGGMLFMSLHQLIAAVDCRGCVDHTYMSLVKNVFGHSAGRWLNLLFLTIPYFQCTVALVAMGDLLSPVFTSFGLGNDESSNVELALTVVACLIIVPLASNDHHGLDKFTPILVFSAIVYITFVLMYNAANEIAEHGSLAETIKGHNVVLGARDSIELFRALPVLFYCGFFHVDVIPIFSHFTAYYPDEYLPLLGVQELDGLSEETKRKCRRVRKKRMDGVIASAVAILVVLEILIGTLGYLVFGDDDEPNFLLRLDDSLLALVGCGIMVFVAFFEATRATSRVFDLAFDFYMRGRSGRSRSSQMVRLTPFNKLSIACVFMLSAMTGALAIRGFLPLVQVTGSTLVVVMAFVIPGFVALNPPYDVDWSLANVVPTTLLIVLCAAAGLIGVAVNFVIQE